jgi:dihydropyrimidinase
MGVMPIERLSVRALEEIDEEDWKTAPDDLRALAMKPEKVKIVADNIQFHEEQDENGVSKMLALKTVDVAPGAQVVLKPSGLHLMLRGTQTPALLDALPEAVQAGHASVKIFTTDIRPLNQGRMVKFGDIWEVLKVMAKAGGLAAIHSEDNDIVMHMYEKLTRENRTGFENLAEVHNTLSEDLSFNRVIRLAENVEGAALYMVHVSAATGVAAIGASRARGFPIYGETLHQYMLYNAEDYKRPGGQMFHTYPSLKFADDQKALWAATNHGAIQAIASAPNAR